MSNLIDSLQWRYATQTFDTSRSLPKDALGTILEAGNLAATAFGLQPFEFVAIQDQTVKDSLLEAVYGQEHLVKNSALIVLAIRTDINDAYITEYIERIADTRKVSVEALDGFKQSMLSAMEVMGPEERNQWSKKQAYIALGTMMAAASELRIDNHGAEGFVPEKLNEILGLTEKNLHATVVLALGYRTEPLNEKDAMFNIKVRKNIDDIVTKL